MDSNGLENLPNYWYKFAQFLLSSVFFVWPWTPHLLNFCFVFFKMDPDYSDALELELGNWTVGGSARLGEAASVVHPTVVPSLPPFARHYPASWSTAVSRPPVLSFIPSPVVPAVSSYEAPPPSSPSTVPASILDSLQVLNQTVGGLIKRVDQQEHSHHLGLRFHLSLQLFRSTTVCLVSLRSTPPLGILPWLVVSRLQFSSSSSSWAPTSSGDSSPTGGRR
jgi:hypothetical protein